MIQPVALAAVVDAVARARTVELSAYVLRPGPLRDALVAAARRGARVRVTLQADPYADPDGALARINGETARALRGAGAAVDAPRRAEAPVHLKAARCDGVAYLDDRNWAGGAETILRDDEPDDVAAVGAALRRVSGATSRLALRKAAALGLEGAVVDAAGAAPLDVASEAFGPGPVARALAARARAGLPTRLVVALREARAAGAGRERALLARLARAGVEIRLADADEKVAVGAGEAWIGSANATSTWRTAAQTDWGLRSRLPSVVAAAQAAFARAWARGAVYPVSSMSAPDARS